MAASWVEPAPPLSASRGSRVGALELLFLFVALLLYVVGGPLAYFGVIPFRMVHVVPPVLLAALVFRVPIALPTKILAVLGVQIIVSGLINSSTLSETLGFMRYVATPLAMWYLADAFSRTRAYPVGMKWLLRIGLLQAPVVIVQRMMFSQLDAMSAVSVAEVDIGSGTFYFENDPSMTFFLLCLALLLTFDERVRYLVTRPNLYIAIFLATIFMSNSLMSLVAAAIAFALAGSAYAIKRGVNLVPFLGGGLIVGLSLATMVTFSRNDAIPERVDFLVKAVEAIAYNDPGYDEAFYRGEYSRVAAIAHYRAASFNWMGDGPSRYFNPYQREFVVGNTGMIFTFYSEVGAVGFGLAVLFFVSVAKNPGANPLLALSIIVASVLLTLTTSVMSDASMMLTLSLACLTGRIPGSRSAKRGQLRVSNQEYEAPRRRPRSEGSDRFETSKKLFGPNGVSI